MTEQEVEQVVAAHQRAVKRRGLGWIAVALGFALLTGGIAVAIDNANEAKDSFSEVQSKAEARDTKIANLEAALNAQRDQFEACKDQKSNFPGCSQPVAPPAERVGPQGIQGVQGIQGIPGPRGPSCIEELGYPKCRGEKGDTGGTGATGSQGNTGQTGATGEKGEKGDKGDKGEKGDKGDTGDQGPVGPAGPPGPACPDGYTQQTVTVLGDGGPKDILTCVAA